MNKKEDRKLKRIQNSKSRFFYATTFATTIFLLIENNDINSNIDKNQNLPIYYSV